MKLNGLDFHVYSKGQPLPEYEVRKDRNTRTITAFIPSQAGKKFRIYWNSQRRENLSVICRIDGQEICRTICSPFGKSCTRGVYVARNRCMPMIFSDLVLLDDESLFLNNAVLEKLGTIEMEVIRVTLAGSRPPPPPPGLKGVGPIHEKSKKVGGHCVSYGKATKCETVTSVGAIQRYSWENYWAKFVFQYRPKAILLAQGVIKKSKSPERDPTTVLIKWSRSAAPDGENQSQNELSGSQQLPAKRVKIERQDDGVVGLS